ncbi:integrase core domain-containing protein [Undibacterium sp. Ji50W]|uniref:integrase core domain-containing protein n=1 Tax=Undibacterium sp. Ji50W TaxID=3413041 RepID=UPI003BF19F9D
MKELGIHQEFSKPGKPWQKGRIERFFLTLKQKLNMTIPVNGLMLDNLLRDFTTWYNVIRPHHTSICIAVRLLRCGMVLVLILVHQNQFSTLGACYRRLCSSAIQLQILLRMPPRMQLRTTEQISLAMNCPHPIKVNQSRTYAYSPTPPASVMQR